MKNILKKILLGIVVLFAIAYILFSWKSQISSDKKIEAALAGTNYHYKVMYNTFKDINYRYVIDTQNFDVEKPNLLFIHGAIGAIGDFEDYLTDEKLRSRFNILALDRPNYGLPYNEDYEHTISFEAELVNDLIRKHSSNTSNNLVGYSYGGPIALLASLEQEYENIILIAPAIDPEYEVVPWLINFYKNKLTRFLVPTVWKEASKEKLAHVADLRNFTEYWSQVTSRVTHIHGDKDTIVPYENVAFLESKIDSALYTHVVIREASHSLVWSNTEEIINHIIDLR
jgi:pimeloyl-ACP methyl ester carboxylesterase